MVAEHVFDHRTDERWSGTLIGSSSVPDDQDRWMELRLYRLDPGSDGHYLAWRNGRSLIYHTGTTRCRTVSGRKPGRLAGKGDLPDDAEPCPDCDPAWPEELADTDRIRYEFDRHTIDRTDTAPEMVKALTQFRERQTGNWVTRVSEPVAEVLEQAAANDPEFARVVLPRQTSRAPMAPKAATG